MKKSIFYKIFSVNIITILVAILILAVTQYGLLSQFVYHEKINDLKENAQTIAGFIKNGVPPERLENFLFGFSRSNGSNILLIDRTGNILIASASESVYNKNIHTIDKKYTQKVFENHEHIEKGDMGGVYNTEMFTLQVPIYSSGQETVIGAIFISTAAPEMARLQSQLGKIIFLSLLMVILISFTLSFPLSRRISKPIKNIVEVAKKFSKGDFSSRVPIDSIHGNIIEIDELTKSFNDMANSIEQAENIRNNFVSDVSHELRTPMTTIGGFVDGILDETIPPERQRDYLGIVKDEIARLSSLVNSFLDITRMQSQSRVLELTNFDINEIIRRTLVGFESKIEEKHININVDLESESCMVYADMNAIRQVLTNLLENAIKFTNDGGDIKISVKVKQQEAIISVYNTGCGIAKNELNLIFERFYKADKSRSLNRNGTGIGLFIVKDILNQHKKNITVSSEEGKFAEFTFSLDVSKN